MDSALKPNPSPFRCPRMSIDHFVRCNAAKPENCMAFWSTLLFYSDEKHQPTPKAKVSFIPPGASLWNSNRPISPTVRHMRILWSNFDKPLILKGRCNFFNGKKITFFSGCLTSGIWRDGCWNWSIKMATHLLAVRVHRSIGFLSRQSRCQKALQTFSRKAGTV